MIQTGPNVSPIGQSVLIHESTTDMQTAEQRYELITRRLQEVLGGDLIKTILAEGRSPKCYWGKYISFDCHVYFSEIFVGTAPTGRRERDLLKPSYNAS